METNMYSNSLPDCGHSFCRPCILKWFDSIGAQRAQAHREQRQNVRAHICSTTNPLDLQLLQLEYNCPTCRAKAKTSPIQNFALKAIVQVVAEAQGEVAPQGASWPSTGNKGKHQRGKRGVWHPYFPEAKRMG